MNHQVIFLDWDNKKKLVPASFFTFKNSYEIKVYLSLKCGIVITVIIILITKKPVKVFFLFTMLMEKSSWKIK